MVQKMTGKYTNIQISEKNSTTSYNGYDMDSYRQEDAQTLYTYLIENAMINAHKYGKWVGICGELGADTTLTEQFVRMGIDELSVAPSMVLKLRKIIREMTV